MKTDIEAKKTPSKMKRNLWGFTIVEFLVAISILATIGIIAYVSYTGHIKSANNTTRVAAIDALNLSLSDYLQQRKTLPEPNSNYITYDTLGTYVHSASSTGAYGISGYVTANFLPKGYVNYTVTDPENKQFYAYGKRINNTSFDVAAALYDSTTGGYKTYIRGTYEKEQLSSLIRSYSSSSFVSADSTEDLPYNPYERKVTAYISSFSGTISLSGAINLTLNSPTSFTGELNSGDKITLGTGSTALLHISDGSELSLGSTGSQTILDLTTLAYSDEHSLASKVILYLSYGETWIEAPHLRTETDSQSDFSISTDSAVAAVRGTVFGVAKNASGSTLSLKEGKIEVGRPPTIGGAGIVASPFTANFIPFATGGFVLDMGTTSTIKSYMIVPEGDTPIELKGIGGSTSTGTLTPESIDAKIYHPRFSLGYRPKPTAMSFTGTPGTAGTAGHTGILSLTLENPGADSYELYFGTGVTSDKSSLRVAPKSPSYTGTISHTGIITITGAFLYSTGAQLSRVLSLKLCYHGRCSDSDNISLTGESFSRGAFQTLGAKRTDTQRTSVIKPVASDTKLTVAGGRSLVAEANYDTGIELRSSTGVVFGGTTIDNLHDNNKWIQYDLAHNKFSDNPGALDTNVLANLDSTKVGFTVSKLSDIAIYGWGGYGTGIILDNNNSAYDKLVYKLSPLTLTSASGFAIEMSVRGAALKRTGSYTYTLFHFGDGNVYGKYKAGYGIYFGSGGSDSVKTGTGYWSGLRNDDFYTVRFEKSGDQYNISLKKSGGELITSTGKILPGSTNSLDHMYVGSDYSYKYQWNDIIDFVKIYQ
ncbi:FecR domain-containing protein [Candidatus Gracilibacteria bacterium]|nr:FecR domain-containing protein [Candidatus Gracilibacteria bacterium]